MRQWLLFCVYGGLLASSPANWELSSYSEFIKGKFHNVALNRDGSLTLSPRLDTIFASEEAYIWGVAQTADGAIYAATGNRGRLYRIDGLSKNGNGKSTLIWAAPQPEIFAIAVDAKGSVYAGTSPNGKIYRIENGQAVEYFDPKSTYIWALACAPDGTLFAATGSEGKIFRVTAKDQGEEYYATGQANVTGLAFDRQGRLLAGSEPNGILYQIPSKDKAFVLYDSNLPEIRAIASDPDGSIYAVGLGGSVAKKTQNATQNPQGTPVTGVPSVTTSITVTSEAAEFKPPPAPEAPKPQPAAASVSTTTTVTDLTGVEKSAIYKIHPDNTVETLWSSKEENVYDLLAFQNHLMFCTDVSGRIYSLSGDRMLSLIAQTNDAEITRLFRSGDSVLAATGNRGRIYRLSGSPASEGTYESPVFDAGSVARWGRLRSLGSGKTSVFTRSGNALRPDRTWSDWSAAAPVIASPNARYVQWKADLSAGARIDSVSVAFLPQNSPPVVRSITALTTTQAVATPAKQSGPATAAYSITVTDTGEAGPATSTGTQIQTLSRASSQNLFVSWQAEDPDGDKLVYALYFRGEGERAWKLLKSDLHDNSFTIDGDSLADGRYAFRVVASDREVNTPGLDGELVSSPVLIDNTPPVFSIQPIKGAALDFEVTDAASLIKRCEYSIDAGPWMPIAPLDGILDSGSARFHLDLTRRPAGEHILVLRAVDSGNNAGLAKIILH